MDLTQVFRSLPTLDTECLILRRLTLDDVEDIFEYAKDPEVARYVTWEANRTIEETRDFVNRILKGYEEGTPRG